MSTAAFTIDIFFSHTTVDRGLVTELTKDAAAMGVRIYTYEEDPRPGEPVAPKLQNQIRQSAAVLALLTKEAAMSSYVQQEIGFALSAGKLVVPLVEDGVPKSCLGMLDGIEYIPFKSGDIESVRHALEKWLASFIAKAQDAAKKAAAAVQEHEAAIAWAVVAVALLLIVLLYAGRKG
jgi:hypothetical protein